MKIKGYHNIHILKFVHYVSYLALIYGFYLMWIGTIHWLPFLIAVFFISNIGESAALHRYFSHKSFQTTPILHKLLCLFATLSTQGSIIHWAGMHRIHHRYSDTINDPVSPHFKGFVAVFFGIIDSSEFNRINKKLVLDNLKDKYVMWFHNWYWVVISTYVLILGIFDPLLILSCYLMPVGVVRYSFGFNNTVNHGYFKNIGYRNYKTFDHSKNSVLFHLITFLSGESFHNNHHYNSRNYNFQDRWWEVDITGIFIKYFLAR